MCQCSELADILLGDDEIISNTPQHPLHGLDEVDWNPSQWAGLNQCAECGQLWHIDIARSNQIGICVKVSDKSEWQQLDTTVARVDLMVQNHGGLSFEICKWKQCNKNCVKGLAFCPEHAYFEMDIKT